MSRDEGHISRWVNVSGLIKSQGCRANCFRVFAWNDEFQAAVGNVTWKTLSISARCMRLHTLTLQPSGNALCFPPLRAEPREATPQHNVPTPLPQIQQVEKKNKKKKQTSSTRRTSHSPLIDWLTLLVAIIFLRPCYQMEPVSAGTWSCLMHLLLCEQMDREETADITQSGGCKKLKRADCVQLGSTMIKGENRYLGKLPV